MTKTIAQINTLDVPGGAARIATLLHCFFKNRGYQSKMIVGTKLGSDLDTVELKFALKEVNGKLPPVQRIIRKLLFLYKALQRRVDVIYGLEDFDNYYCSYIEEILPDQTDIILCHNLHGGYFDLSTLPALSKRHPVILLMHDPWLLGGHCAHSFDCEKWVSGCGECPHLDVQYALERDSSHLNWLRKKKIFDTCRLYVISPSQWLMDKVEHSILKPAAIKTRVINNGVDQTMFYPSDKKLARAALGINADDHVVMFAANGIRESIWKDYATMRAAVGEVAQTIPEKSLRFLAVGENAPDEKIGSATITFIPHKSSEDMARYYQSADVYIHAARAENFPNTILEALSCGTPVIATAVGGVSEQIRGLRYEGDKSGLNHYDLSDATGILTPVGDVGALSNALCQMFLKPKILQQLSLSAAKDARMRFNLETIGNQYLEFFDEVIADWKGHSHSRAPAKAGQKHSTNI